MDFNLKPESNSSSFGDQPKIDYNAINNQVEADNTPAILSLIVDLGVHTPPLNVSDQGSADFETEEEANDYLAQIIEIKGEKDGAKFKISQEGDKFTINGNIYQPKDGQEVAIFADLVDNIVDYGDEIGKKPYRIVLNKSWMGELKGFSLKAVPPQKGSKVWTFAGNSMLTKLAKATKNDVIIDGSDAKKLNNIGLMLGSKIMADVVKNVSGENTYVNIAGVSSIPKALEATVDTSLVEPIGISFTNATLELLEKACLRGNIFKKIKSANNYKGSNIQKAIEEYEEKHGGGVQPTQTTESKTDTQVNDGDTTTVEDEDF